jgi:hypothetical protein
MVTSEMGVRQNLISRLGCNPRREAETRQPIAHRLRHLPSDGQQPTYQMRPWWMPTTLTPAISTQIVHSEWHSRPFRLEHRSDGSGVG